MFKTCKVFAIYLTLVFEFPLNFRLSASPEIEIFTFAQSHKSTHCTNPGMCKQNISKFKIFDLINYIW